MKLTDWLGNEFGVGDTVIYIKGDGSWKGMAQGTVLDIYKVYYSREIYKNKRLEEGEEPPMEERRGSYDHEKKEFGPTTIRPVRTYTYVKVQPNNVTSRGNKYDDENWVWNSEKGEYDKFPRPIRQVVLKIAANITKLVGN